jgi:electron transfer flavoprotein beta subunit
MLSIVVCVKAVPDPSEADKIRVDPVTKALPRHEIELVLNPLDRHALEAALQQKEHDDTHVTVISMGPPLAGNIIKECLALGADVGILLSDPAFAGADVYATAFTLANAVKKLENVDCILCGRASSDGATEWVGPELATLLGMPVVTMVNEFVQTDGSKWIVKADVENGYRLVEADLPAVFTVTHDANEPQILSFSGIIKARTKEITIWNLGDLGLSEEAVGETSSPTIVSELASVELMRNCEMIEGTLEEKADLLIEKLSRAGVL